MQGSFQRPLNAIDVPPRRIAGYGRVLHWAANSRKRGAQVSLSMRKNSRRMLLLPALFASFGLAVSGCSTPGDAAPARSPAATTDFVREVTEEEADTLFAAEQIRLRACMEKRGFTYVVIPRRLVPELRDFPYVLDDIAWARKHGYGSQLRRRLETLTATNPNERYHDGLRPAQKSSAIRAMNGDTGNGDGDLKAVLPGGSVITRSSAGCTSVAEQEVYGDLPTWYRVKRVTTALRGMRTGEVHGDARFQRTLGLWSQCMRKHGHPYATPAEAREAVPAAVGPALATAGVPVAEVRRAVTEATCAHRSGLAATASELDRHYASLIRDRYRADVAAKLRLELDALPRARAITAQAAT